MPVNNGKGSAEQLSSEDIARNTLKRIGQRQRIDLLCISHFKIDTQLATVEKQNKQCHTITVTLPPPENLPRPRAL
jgi:hypothetical protein